MSSNSNPEKLTPYQKRKQKKEMGEKILNSLPEFIEKQKTIERTEEEQAELKNLHNNFKNFILLQRSIEEKYNKLLETIFSNKHSLDDFHAECVNMNLSPDMIMLLEIIIGRLDLKASEDERERTKALHSKGGMKASSNYTKQQKTVINAWESGKYKTMKECAEANFLKACISYYTALRYIRNHKNSKKNAEIC